MRTYSRAISLLSILTIIFMLLGCSGSSDPVNNGTDTTPTPTPTPVPTPTVDMSNILNIWHQVVPLPQPATLNSVIFASGLFVSGGLSGTILTSTDGSTWTLRHGGGGDSSNIRSLAYGNGGYIAVGGVKTFFTGLIGIIFYSQDAINWTMVSPVYQPAENGSFLILSGPFLASAAFGSGIFSAAALMKSIDGINWTDVAYTHNSYAMTFGNNMFVSGSNYGEIWTSSDGLSWQQRYFSTSRPALFGAAYGNGTFIVVGDGGVILRSVDGVTWNSQTSGTTIRLNGVAYGNNIFVAVGDNGTILISPDGITWTGKYSGTTKNLHGAAFGNNVFVTVGDDGMMLFSDPVQ